MVIILLYQSFREICIPYMSELGKLELACFSCVECLKLVQASIRNYSKLLHDHVGCREHLHMYEEVTVVV